METKVKINEAIEKDMVTAKQTVDAETEGLT
jgi:hypothetical protein